MVKVLPRMFFSVQNFQSKETCKVIDVILFFNFRALFMSHFFLYFSQTFKHRTLPNFNEKTA